MNRVPDTPARNDWHALSTDSAFDSLETSPEGLSTDLVQKRLEQHGPNRLPEEEKESVLIRFLRHFHNLLIYILLLAAVVTALLDHWVDTGVILAVVVVNAVIGFIQEGKAERALEGIREMLSLEATVIRNGHRRNVKADDLVPGDIVILESGDRVPADVRLFQCRNLQVEEAALTGESEPVKKSPDPLPQNTLLGDRRNMAYSSTLVTYGQGRGIVAGTGVNTEIGRIGEMISGVEELKTPLLRQIDQFGKWLSGTIVLFCGLIFLFAYFMRDYAFDDLFLLVVGFAVAAIPEGLPAIMTITLAIGVQAMARRNAIVRKLPAVETLGSVTVICSDKTGTLTRNEMTATSVVTPDHMFRVTGSGYAPEGKLMLNERELNFSDYPEIEELARAGLLSSDSEVVRDDEGHWVLEGEPTEGAVVTLAMKAGLNHADEFKAHERLDMIPFESENRFMASLHRTANGNHIVFVKGAPERLLEMCESQRSKNGDTDLDRPFWKETMEAIARRGQRLLAVAVKTAGARTTLEPDDIYCGCTLLGLVGLIDPPREEAIEAIRECRTAGIRVKMITGDHALTARTIGLELGIGDGEKFLTGSDLEEMNDDELARAAPEYDVFARTSPEHKLRLVRALQVNNQIVAMTGDGVNDAPALKRADVGVAMGIKGSQATRDAAEMVLADDNFKSIAEAVKEGRTIYDNLKKAILFILPTNGGESLVLLASVIFAFTQLPITPAQILWVNMITAVTLALALAFEPPEKGVMTRPPRDPRAPILSGYLIWRIAFVSILLSLAVLFLFFRALDAGSTIEVAQTTAVNALVAGQALYLLNSRYILLPSFTLEGLFGNRYAFYAVAILVVFQAVFTYTPFMQLWFGTAALPVDTWPWIIGAGLFVFACVEIEKTIVRKVRAI